MSRRGGTCLLLDFLARSADRDRHCGRRVRVRRRDGANAGAQGRLRGGASMPMIVCDLLLFYAAPWVTGIVISVQAAHLKR
jgi:hypothetical protein